MIAEYPELDALALADLVRRGEVHAREVLDTALARIEALNPALNAIVTPLFDQAEAAVAAGLPDGPFRGVPFVFKELSVSVAGSVTTSASRLLASGPPAAADSEAVARCRRAGMVVVGRSNSSELGLAPACEPALFGPTRNPWDLTRTAGGSSGGSAAAVAAGLLPMGHATDGGGSIRIPAACCGLFGLKPTRGRITAGPQGGEGLAGLSTQLAVTRSVRDSAALLDVMAGPLPGDPWFAAPPARPYAQEVTADPGRLRIAFTTAAPDGAHIDPDCAAAILDAAHLCESLGHEVVEAAPRFDITAMQQALGALFIANTALNITRATGGSLPAEGIEPMTRALAARGLTMPATAYIAHQHAAQRESRHIAGFFADHDIWLTPSLSIPAPPLGWFDTARLDVDGWGRAFFDFVPFAWLANITGQPAMSVPLVQSASGLPIGCHFTARWGEEDTLLRLAGQLERAAPWEGRRPPAIA